MLFCKEFMPYNFRKINVIRIFTNNYYPCEESIFGESSSVEDFFEF